MEILKGIIVLFCMALLFVISTVIMIYGWGIEPKNWVVIVAGYIATIVLMAISQLAQSIKQ